jgi:hypothetical protein
MNALGLLLLAVLMLSCAPTGGEPVEDPIVVILRDGQPSCSGFAVGPHELLTAAHCVDDRREVAFVTEPQWRLSARGFSIARVLWADPDRDLARLHTKLNFSAPFRLRAPIEGEAVEARSVFYGGTTRGGLLEGAGYFRDSTLTVIPGWSGSPVLGGDGSAVGVIRSCRGGIVGAVKFCLPDNAAIVVLP